MSDDFGDLRIDHVEFFVGDAAASATELVRRYGFEIFGVSGAPDPGSEHYSLAVRQGRITLVLTQGVSDQHPASAYVQSHGDGVANIALRTRDAAAVHAGAIARGARSAGEPVRWASPGSFVTASIFGFGDVTHTFVQRPEGLDAQHHLPGFTDWTGAAPDLAADAVPPNLLEIDHFAVCLEVDSLDPTVEYYQQVLDFRVIFEEHIKVGAQAMLSQVVQSASGDVTLTLIQPDPRAEAGQIDSFLKEHNGPGVQHIAFLSDSVVHSVGTLGRRGVEFLNTPAAYYRLLAERLQLIRYGIAELKDLNILVDEDHDGQLYQIFARSVHPRRTFFFEVIERLGAKTFGSGNIRALYEAVEAERIKTQDVL